MKLTIKGSARNTLAITLAGVFLISSTPVFASSHREAPLISGDPKADATDLYAFVSPDKPDTVTLIANYSPFENPAGGPNFDSFDDNVLYEINVDNNGDAKPDITYQFRFTTTRPNPNTFLYNTGTITSDTDPNWNAQQTYTLTKVENGVSTVLGTNLPTPPVNVGPKSTPNYAALQAQALHPLSTGETVFAGQSDDPFFVDLGALFDLLSIRTLPGNAGGGVNTTQGSNVHSLALQIPITQLTSDHSMPASATSTAAVLGFWTTASRQTTSVINTDGSVTKSGDWVQVSRLGSPLVNEVVIPVGMKDHFNASKPQDDAQFANYVANPELGSLLKGIYNIAVPPQGNFGTASQRDDLEAIFLTGIPGLTKPANVVPAEELRLNVAIPPTPTPNKMGVLAGDNAGYPNGRRLGDDVVDISLQAVAGAAYPLFHPGFTVDPTGAKLGDGVNANDLPFRPSFPYMALPFGGYESLPHSSSGIAGILNDTIAALQAEISVLEAKILSLTGQGGGTTGGSGGSATSTPATSTPNMPTPGPTNMMTARAGTSVDINGRNFGHEETVTISLNGSTVTTAHADGGGNFSSGSVTVPSTPGVYLYLVSGNTSGIKQSTQVTVTN